MLEPVVAGQLLVIALFSGSTACWLLRLDDTLMLTLSSGVAGLYLEPWVSVGVGPELFDHSVVSCMAGAVACAFLLGLLQSVMAAWIIPRYRHLLS